MKYGGLISNSPAFVASSTLHELRATARTVHWGYFNSSLAPVLTVKSGDLIQAETVTPHAGDDPDLMLDPAIERLFSAISPEDRHPGPHILTGPIYVEGVRPGDMLEVRYLRMTPRCPYGSNVSAPWGYLYGELGRKDRVTIFRIDEASNTAEALYAYNYPRKYELAGAIHRCPQCDRESALRGIRVPIRPHLGVAGVVPDMPGRISTIPPGNHGGNIDNWRIGAGTTMYYRAQVDGALFSIGDPHISQGDGEISGTAIESSLDVLLQIIVRRDFTFPSPLLEAPDCWIVHGFNQDLNLATREAALNMLGLLTDQLGLSKDDAYSLMSIAADFGVTQVVDGRQGIHVRMPRGIFPSGQPGLEWP